MNKNMLLTDFIKYVSFNVLGMIGLSCYILADTFFVSKGLGADGLAALNLAIPIYSFIHGSGLMLGMGGGIKYSIFKSKHKMTDANHIFTNTVILTFGIAAFFVVIGLFFSETMTWILGADETIFQMSNTYLQVILLFAPAFMINNLLLCFVRNDGAPRLSMIAMLSGSLSNIILDYLFIFPLKMGMFGAVLATGFAPIISILILSSFFFKKKNSFHPYPCKVSGRLMRGIFSSGLPSFITEVSSGIVMIVFNTIILNLQGNIGVAAYGIIANLSLVVLSIYTGIAQGIQPMLSCNYGMFNRTNVKAILRYALITMTVISGIIYLYIFFGASQIAEIFNNEQNALLQNIAVAGLKIYFTACVFAGFNIIISVYFTSTQYLRPAHIISILRGFLLIVPMAFLLSKIGGMTGVWSVFPITELIVFGIGFALYHFHKKKAENINTE